MSCKQTNGLALFVLLRLLDNLARPNKTNEYELPASKVEETLFSFIVSFTLFAGDVIDSWQ